MFWWKMREEVGLYCCVLHVLYWGLACGGGDDYYIHISFPLILQGVSLPPSRFSSTLHVLYLGCSSPALSVAGAGLTMLRKYEAAVNFEKLLKGGGATSQAFR